MTGTLVNAATVLVGGGIGLAVHGRLPEGHRRIAFDALGLATVVLGVMMAQRTESALILILALLAGGLLGQTLAIEAWVQGLAEGLKTRVGARQASFSEGLVTAFLIFCMGPLTILGAMDEGMGFGAELLFAKAALDGFAALALASTLGVGVLFSVLPLLLYQGAWTLVGLFVGETLPEAMVAEISAVGGVLLIGLALDLLGLKKIALLNLLPALLFALLFAWLLPLIGL